MRKRLALSTLVVALLALGSLPASPVRAAEVTYDFEACEQGWEPKKGGAWVRSDLHPGSTNAGMAMSNIVYADQQDRGDTLISKPHTWGGGKGKIKLRARWHFEWWPPEASGAGLSTTDRAALEISIDGGKTWKPRAGFSFPNPTFPEFDNVEVDFEAPAGTFLLRFTLYSDANLNGFGIEVDDIVVPTPAPDGTACK